VEEAVEELVQLVVQEDQVAVVVVLVLVLPQLQQEQGILLPLVLLKVIQVDLE
tara:strand:- start:377 stop:535 length:159 start_codon:yes stop_codon:yes gene_type:complete